MRQTAQPYTSNGSHAREIGITANCQVKRLWLVSKSDTFANAFISTHLITHFLAGNMEKRLRSALDWYRCKSDYDCAY